MRQLDTGINLRANYHTFIVSGGLWYRGIPLWKQEMGQLHLDAPSAMLSLKVGDGFVLGYSLDLPVIRPYTSLMRTAHELCLVISIGHRHQRRGHNFVQFPFTGRY